MKRKSKFLFYQSEGEDFCILLGKRKDSSGEEFWWIPGGSVEGEEELFEAGIRELNEELTITSIIDQATKKYSVASPPPFVRYSTEKSEVTVFLMQTPGEKETPLSKEEFTEIKWFPLSGLPSEMSREFVNIKPYLTVSFLKIISSP